MQFKVDETDGDTVIEDVQEFRRLVQFARALDDQVDGGRITAGDALKNLKDIVAEDAPRAAAMASVLNA